MPETTAPLGRGPDSSRQHTPTTIRTIYGLLHLTIVVATVATIAATISYLGASGAFAAEYANNPEAFISGLLQAVALIAVCSITVVWLWLKATGAWQFATVSTAILAVASITVAVTQVGGLSSSSMPGLIVHPTLLGTSTAIVMVSVFSLLLTKPARAWYPNHDVA